MLFAQRRMEWGGRRNFHRCVCLPLMMSACMPVYVRALVHHFKQSLFRYQGHYHSSVFFFSLSISRSAFAFIDWLIDWLIDSFIHSFIFAVFSPVSFFSLLSLFRSSSFRLSYLPPYFQILLHLLFTKIRPIVFFNSIISSVLPSLLHSFIHSFLLFFLLSFLFVFLRSFPLWTSNQLNQ